MFKILDSHNIALMAIIIASVVGGAMPVFIKIALKEIPAFSFTFFRFLIASLFLIPFLLREKNSKRVSRKLIAISVLATVNVFFFAFGVMLTTASAGQMLYTSVPIIAAILSYFLLKEKIGLRKALGVTLGFLGATTIVILPLLGKSGFAGDLFGNLLIVVAVASFAVYSVLSKRIQERYSPLYITTVFSLLTMFVAAIFMVNDFANYPSWWNAVSLESIVATVYVGIFGTFIFHLLYQYAIKHGTPLIASMILYLQPLMTFIWAFALLGEMLTIVFVLGSIFTFIGVWMTTKKGK